MQKLAGSEFLSRLKTWICKIPLLGCISLFLIHFALIWKYAVNIPSWDDWTLIYIDYPARLSWQWLFEQANEHRTSTTKLFVWLQYQLNHWNLRTHQIVAFLIYGLFLILLTRFAKRFAPQAPTYVTLSFIIFLLSTIVWLNHFEGYASAIHFWITFFFAAAFLLFREPQKWLTLIAGCVCAILSIYSFAAGFVACLILLIVFGLFKGRRALSSGAGATRRKELTQLLMVVVVIGGALAVWTVYYQKPGYLPSPMPPYSWKFWQLLLNLVSFSFGIDRFSIVWGVICLLIILVPLLGIVWKSGWKLTTGEWATLACTLSLLAVHSSIAMGRAFDLNFAKNQEYAEHGMPLIILSVMAWSFFLQKREKLRRGMLVGLWLFCFIAFTDNWYPHYRDLSVQRLAGVECVRTYYFQHGEARCPTIYPPNNPLYGALDRAKALDISFYQEMRAKNEASR
jgi:hypothetical protein